MPDQLAPVADKAGVVVRKVDLDDRLAADVDWKQINEVETFSTLAVFQPLVLLDDGTGKADGRGCALQISHEILNLRH